MKKILNVFVLGAIVCAAVYTLFEMSEREISLTDPWTCVPASAALVLEFPDPASAWSELANRSQVWQSLREHPNVEYIHSLFSNAFDAPLNDPAIHPFCQRPMLVAIKQKSADKFGLLLILASEGDMQTEQLLDLLSCIDPSVIDRADKTGDDTYILELDDGWGAIHVRHQQDLLLISSDKSMLNLSPEDSLFTDQLAIRSLRETLGEGADAHVMMNTDRMEGFMDLFIHPEQQRQLHLPAGFAALDLEFNPQVLLMSGVVASNNKNAFHEFGQLGGPNRPHTMVPRDVSYIYNTHIEDVIGFTDQFIEQGSETEDLLKEYRDSLSIDMQELFASWLGGELLVALQDDNPSLKWACARALDGISASEAFDHLKDAYQNAGQEVIKNEGGKSVSYYFPQAIPLSIFGPAFKKINPTHVGISEDVVVFASSENSLQKALSSLAMERVLASEERAMEQFSDLPENHRLMIWCDLARSKELASYYVDVERAEGDTSSLDALGTFSLIIGGSSNDLTHVSMSLQHAPIEEKAQSNLIWRNELAARVTRKPDILEDHTSAGKNILVQDEEHRLYFFSSAGERLWDRDIKESIIGEVVQVDRYRNGKLQMLFNTSDKIHLIDRNGKNVDGFPIPIGNATSAPLSLIDYEGDKEYRILLSDDNGILLNYDLSGKSVKGWDPMQLPAGSQHRIQHLRIKTKDFLCVVDGNGKTHLLDRRGKTRYKTSLSLEGIGKNYYHLTSALTAGASTVDWTDTLGQLWRGTLDGKAELVTPGTWHGQTCLMTDLDDDDRIDLVRAAADSLNIQCSSLGSITIKTDGMITGAPHVFSFGKGRKRIGLTTDAASGLFLYDITGNSTLDEPLEGNSAFSISDLTADGKLEIVTSNLMNELVVLRCP